jgi:dynein heavy chain
VVKSINHCSTSYLEIYFSTQELNKEEELLEWEPSQFPVLQEMIAYKEPYDKLWRTAFNFHNKHEHWLNGKFNDNI